VTSAADSEWTEAAIACSQCTQPLYLRAEGRDRCERCPLGRAELVRPDVVAAEAAGTRETAVDRAACAGCGRSQTEQGGFPLA